MCVLIRITIRRLYIQLNFYKLTIKVLELFIKMNSENNRITLSIIVALEPTNKQIYPEIRSPQQRLEYS